jgi:hypothetical protein
MTNCQILKFGTKGKTYIQKVANFKLFFTQFYISNTCIPMDPKHYKSILIVTKYFTNLCNNKEGNARLIKNMNNCVSFRKNWYYYANLKATNFVLLDKTCISIGLNYDNANIPKKSPLHFPMRVSDLGW